MWPAGVPAMVAAAARVASLFWTLSGALLAGWKQLHGLRVEMNLKLSRLSEDQYDFGYYYNYYVLKEIF